MAKYRVGKLKDKILVTGSNKEELLNSLKPYEAAVVTNDKGSISLKTKNGELASNGKSVNVEYPKKYIECSSAAPFNADFNSLKNVGEEYAVFYITKDSFDDNNIVPDVNEDNEEYPDMIKGKKICTLFIDSKYKEFDSINYLNLPITDIYDISITAMSRIELYISNPDNIYNGDQDNTASAHLLNNEIVKIGPVLQNLLGERSDNIFILQAKYPEDVGLGCDDWGGSFLLKEFPGTHIPSSPLMFIPLDYDLEGIYYDTNCYDYYPTYYIQRFSPDGKLIEGYSVFQFKQVDNIEEYLKSL